MGYESTKGKKGILCWLSILLFVAGAAILGSVVFLNSYSQWSSGGGTPSPGEMIKGVSSAVLVICALVSIGVGVMGCLVTKCEHKCFIMLFGCGLGTNALIIFIVGCIFSSTATWMPNMAETLCMPKTAEQAANTTF